VDIEKREYPVFGKGGSQQRMGNGRRHYREYTHFNEGPPIHGQGSPAGHP
jgi:hypothetical protein